MEAAIFVSALCPPLGLRKAVRMTDQQRPSWAVRLEAERSARRWNKHEMARRLLAAAGLEQGSVRNLARQIHRWEAGKVFPRDWATAYAIAFELDETDLFGCSPRPVEGQSTALAGNVVGRTRPDDGDEDVRRRALLELMAVLGAGMAVPVASVDTALAALEDSLGRQAAELDVPDWQNTAWQYSQTIWVQPVGVLMHDLTADIMALGAALQRESRPPVRQELLRVSAQLAAYMAQELSDMGRLRDARRSLQAAAHAADESGDRDLSTWVRSYHASRALWEDRPVQIVSGLLDDALGHASGRPTAGLAKALMIHAQLLATQGDAVGAGKALHNLRQVFGNLPDHITQDRISPHGYPEGALWETEGFAYAILGDTKRAVSATDQAFSLMPEERSGSRTNINLMRALALVRDRDITEGLTHAVETMRGMPTSTSRRRITGEILKALPDEKSRTLPAARELRALTIGKA
jgi:tetratricopeptide (TPR) repeat protein